MQAGGLHIENCSSNAVAHISRLALVSEIDYSSLVSKNWLADNQIMKDQTLQRSSSSLHNFHDFV